MKRVCGPGNEAIYTVNVIFLSHSKWYTRGVKGVSEGNRNTISQGLPWEDVRVALLSCRRDTGRRDPARTKVFLLHRKEMFLCGEGRCVVIPRPKYIGLAAVSDRGSSYLRGTTCHRVYRPSCGETSTGL